MCSEGLQILKSLGECQCSFCYCNIQDGEGVMLNMCLHVFCRPCLVIAINESDAPQIKCPVDDETNCGGCFLDPEIKSLVSTEAYEKYLSRSLALATKEDGQLYKCQQKDCPGIYCLENGVTSFQCEICFEINCTKCKGIHAAKKSCPTPSRCDKRKNEANVCLEEAEKKKRLDEARADTELKQDWDVRWEQMKSLVEANNSMKGEGNASALVDLLQNSDLLIATKSFECSICMCDAPAGEGIILQECFHTFCKDCLKSTIEFCDDPEVKCPFQGTHTSCTALIQEREVKALVSKEIYERYLSRSISKAEICNGNAFHCKSVNCTGWCEAEEGAEQFDCPICKKVNCVKCKTIHEAVSCKEYQYALLHEGHDNASTAALNELITSKKAMRCPTCKIIIIKNGGCDGIQCRICKTWLCWATKGPRWGPKGTGDNSGGCKCNVDGKPCHPSCQNCH